MSLLDYVHADKNRSELRQYDDQRLLISMILLKSISSNDDW